MWNPHLAKLAGVLAHDAGRGRRGCQIPGSVTEAPTSVPSAEGSASLSLCTCKNKHRAIKVILAPILITSDHTIEILCSMSLEMQENDVAAYSSASRRSPVN